LWIGFVPVEYQQLSFAEQLLMAQYYPRVYVFKLWPKGGICNTDHLQHGMRGNVTSYEHNMSGIASMLEGNLMPRLVAVLASVLSVTFIGL
ncbi:hypothetical protein CPB85DRAFT_1213262, partial [Mucidula mucida]